MREPADWMRPIDDRLLEALRDEGNLNPATVAKMGVTVADYASDRLGKMAEAGLVDRIGPGLYRLTDEGRAYLEEDLDANELPTPESEQDGNGDDE